MGMREKKFNDIKSVVGVFEEISDFCLISRIYSKICCGLFARVLCTENIKKL